MREKIVDGLVKLIEILDQDITLIQIRNSVGNSRIWSRTVSLPPEIDWEAEVRLANGELYTPEEAWKKILESHDEQNS